MGDILIKEAIALLQVLAVGVLLGAGVPAIYALGMRAVSIGRRTTPDGQELVGPMPLKARVISGLCFGLAILACLFGIVVIIFGKQIFR